MVEEVLNNYISNAINHAQGSKTIEINLEQKMKLWLVYLTQATIFHKMRLTKSGISL